MKKSELKAMGKTLDSLNEEIKESRVTHAYRMYAKTKKIAQPILLSLAVNNCMDCEECVWVPSFDCLIYYAPYFFDKENLECIKPVFEKAMDFIESMKNASSDWTRQTLLNRLMLAYNLESLFGKLPRDASVMQSEFAKQYQASYPNIDMREALFLWEQAGHVRRIKKGRSYEVTLGA